MYGLWSAQAIMYSGMFRDSLPVHLLFKPEHTAAFLIGLFFAGLRIVGIRMLAVEEFNNMKAAAVDVEMNILLRIRYCHVFHTSDA